MNEEGVQYYNNLIDELLANSEYQQHLQLLHSFSKSMYHESSTPLEPFLY